MFVVTNWLSKGQEQVVADFKKETGEPWMTQDTRCAHGDVSIMKEALQKAGKADRRAISEAIRPSNTTEGPAKFFPGGRVKFVEHGRRDGAVAEWQWRQPRSGQSTPAN